MGFSWGGAALESSTCSGEGELTPFYAEKVAVAESLSFVGENVPVHYTG